MTMDDAAPERPQAYSCGPIVVLEGHEAVRLRPGMYFGDIHDGSGLHHLATEVIDNVIDQHVADHCFRLAVTIHRGGALTVEDDGPGIPVEPVVVRDERRPALEIILTRLLGYRDHREGTYRRSGGMHGIGLGAVNAVCERLVVEVRRGGRLHRISCRRGKLEGPIANLGAAEPTGTRVTLHPDPLVFPSTQFDARRLLAMLRPLAFLHPGLRIEFTDERPGGVRETLHGRGIAGWVALLGEGQDGYPDEPLRLRAARLDVTVDVALRWTRCRRDGCLRLFANDHEVDAAPLAHGIAKGVKRAARRAGMEWTLRGWEPARLTDGLTAIADVRGTKLEVTGPYSGHLGNLGARLLRDAVAQKLAGALKFRPALLEALARLAVG